MGAGSGIMSPVTIGAIDVLVLAALKEELDAILEVKDGVLEAWARVEGDPPLHTVVLDGAHGPIRVVAVRQTKMAGVTTASLASRLIERLQPRCLAMCGVCAGHPEDTDLGDVVIAERLFQHDEGKSRRDGFQGDLWVDALRADWLHVAQDMAGPGTAFSMYRPPAGEDWKWWFLERLSAGRSPLQSCALRRYVPDDVRPERFSALRAEKLVTWKGKNIQLTKAGSRAVEENQLLHGSLARSLPFHVHVGPMGSGNAVEASGKIWGSVGSTGQRKVLAVEMEAAAIGRVAHERGLPFAVAKGVMDRADPVKSDRFKEFAARAAAAVLCGFLRKVVEPSGASSTTIRRGPEEGARARLRKVPARKGAGPVAQAVEQPVEHEMRDHPGGALQALESFLTDSFVSWELRKLAKLCDVASSLQENASLDQLAWQLVDVLSRRGLLKDVFFQVLEAQPGVSVERVRALQRGIAASAASPAPTAKAPVEEEPKVVKRKVKAVAASGVPTSTDASVVGEPKVAKRKVKAAAASAVSVEVEPKARRPKAKAGGKAVAEETAANGRVLAGGENAREGGDEEDRGQREEKVRARIVEVLKGSDKLAASLERRLEPEKGKDRARRGKQASLAERAAQRILELGTGFDAAYKLVDAVFDAVLGKNKDAEGERAVARALLCEWLPYGYTELARVGVLPLKKYPTTSRNREIKTTHEHFIEVHMARIDGRKCRFTTTKIDSRGGKTVAEPMLAWPPQASERTSPDQAVDLIIEAIGERFGAKTLDEAAARDIVQAKLGVTLYVVIAGRQRLREAAVHRLNNEFRHLHIVVRSEPDPSVRSRDEVTLWTMVEEFFKDGG